MSEAWIMPQSVTAPFEENRLSPNIPVSYEELEDLGLYHRRVAVSCGEDADGEAQNNFIEGTLIQNLLTSHKYASYDRVNITRGVMDDFDTKLKIFFNTHIHEDEEIRLIEGGSGYFDVLREKGAVEGADQDEWIRIKSMPGDLIVLPAGIFHRFTVDTNESTRAIRLFKENPKWIAINSPAADANEYHLAYLQSLRAENQVTVISPVSMALRNALRTSETIDSASPLWKGTHTVMLRHPKSFDDNFTALINGVLRNAQDGVLVLYFTGSPTPQTKKSWCPDCVIAEDSVQKIVRDLGAKREQVIFLQFNVTRSSYMGNPDYLLRKHSFVQLQSVPTLFIVQKKDIASPTANPYDAVSVLLKEENPVADWVEKNM